MAPLSGVGPAPPTHATHPLPSPLPQPATTSSPRAPTWPRCSAACRPQCRWPSLSTPSTPTWILWCGAGGHRRVAVLGADTGCAKQRGIGGSGIMHARSHALALTAPLTDAPSWPCAPSLSAVGPQPAARRRHRRPVPPLCSRDLLTAACRPVNIHCARGAAPAHRVEPLDARPACSRQPHARRPLAWPMRSCPARSPVEPLPCYPCVAPHIGLHARAGGGARWPGSRRRGRQPLRLGGALVGRGCGRAGRS